VPESRRPGSLLRQFGQGLVAGATDDDPSGIATCSRGGAQPGCAGCWILLLCYPMMVAAREISGRIGRATGGIVAALRTRCPRWVVYLVTALIAVPNIVNLGVDPGAMAEGLRLMIGGPRLAYVALFDALCAGLLINAPTLGRGLQHSAGWLRRIDGARSSS